MERASTESHIDLDQLHRHHTDLELRLQELEHHLSHSPDEEVEIHRLKKLKLATKDRIAVLSIRGSA